ncbi:MAG: hypothetical protein PF572_01195 [Patescibacteria group bacterium]|jgi:hypothetical protein|nr:hypothetical protein [Patescibacteria group bacterium]
MKKLIIIPIIASLLLLTACSEKLPAQPHVVQDTKASITGDYLGSYFKENYVWGGAMNLAWNDLNENILNEKLQLRTEDVIALTMIEKLNNPIFTKEDLDDKSYYIKSGYGQETVDIINKESKKKFPSKSFGDLDMNLAKKDIISYAYFLKEVEYKTIFTEKEVFFNGEKLRGFYAKTGAEKDNVRVLKYESDDKFIVRIDLEDQEDQLILAKGYDMTNPEIVLSEINSNNKEYLKTISSADSFEAPKLHLDHNRDYVELINKYLDNKNFKDYFIAQMFENIKFDMDEKGARVENEAAIVMPGNAVMKPQDPRNFILDEPYWIIMKRSDSQKPYFILGVNNTELMEKY